MREELLNRAIELRKKSEEVESNLEFVTGQIEELGRFSEGLKFLSVGEKEILSNLGRGVFTKANMVEGEKLFVDVGAGVFVRKTQEETREIIQGQMRKFGEAKVRLTAELENLAMQLGQMMGDVERLRKEKK